MFVAFDIRSISGLTETEVGRYISGVYFQVTPDSIDDKTLEAYLPTECEAVYD